MRGHLGLKAWGIKTLVALVGYVREEGSVVAGTPGAGGAGSGNGVEGEVFAVEGRVGKRQIEVGLYPRGDVLGGEQVRLLVAPVLAPALGESIRLVLQWETGDQVGMAGRDAFPGERFCYFGDELQQGQTGVDVGSALA